MRAARRQEARRRARASSRGGVWRKPNPKMRGDLSACERTGRRTETGYEVWYARGELAPVCVRRHRQA